MPIGNGATSDWRNEPRRVPVKIYVGTSVSHWLETLAYGQRRRNSGEMARILLEECFENSMTALEDGAVEVDPPVKRPRKHA